MSEEQESTGSNLKKTILGTIATVVTAGGAWLASTLFGGGKEDKPAPVQTAPVINITNSNQQSQAVGNKTYIINQKASDSAKPTHKKKEADEFKEKPAAW